MSNVSKRTHQRQRPVVWALTILAGLWLPVGLVAQPPPALKRPLVEIRTSAGNLIVALFNETPAHRDRFLGLVDDGEYDSLLFHRVVRGFAIEGGDMASKHAPRGTALGMDADSVGLAEEIAPGLIHKRGALSAAPAGETPECAGRTHSSRFFFVLGDLYTKEELDAVAERNTASGRPYTYTEAEILDYASEGGLPRLDGAYTVFGEIVDGWEVLDTLAALPCNEWDRPLEDVRMFMRRLQ